MSHVTNNCTPISLTWTQARAEVVRRLDVIEEYTKLGAKFDTTTPNGNGWVPCHAIGREDDDPSAGVHSETACYHDFIEDGLAGSIFDIAVAVGNFSEFNEAFRHYAGITGVPLPSSNGKSKRPKRKAGDKGEFVCCYIYRDENGQKIYGVNRHRLANGDKRFVQFRFGPDGKKIWKMAGVQYVPYNLPEVLAAIKAGRPVFICEGEKAVDAMKRLHLTGTCSPMGAGKWLGHDYSQWFRDGKIIIVPDNDDPGRKHAATVARDLHGVAKNIRWVEIPGLPPAGDIYDWLETGPTDTLRRQLFNLCRDAALWEPSADEWSDLADTDSDATSIGDSGRTPIIVDVDEPRVVTESIEALAKVENLYRAAASWCKSFPTPRHRPRSAGHLTHSVLCRSPNRDCGS